MASSARPGNRQRAGLLDIGWDHGLGRRFEPVRLGGWASVRLLYTSVSRTCQPVPSSSSAALMVCVPQPAAQRKKALQTAD